MPLSETAEETANTFRALGLSKNIDFSVNIAPGITLCGSPDEIRRLLSVLLDNAMKNTPDGGKVSLRLFTEKKCAVLTVKNTSKSQINKEELKCVFDRFYRTDESRNSELGGQGIGLSVAKAIVLSHGGEIKAITETGNDFCIIASFPLK